MAHSQRARSWKHRLGAVITLGIVGALLTGCIVYEPGHPYYDDRDSYYHHRW
jgi:hypothetical protein